MQVFKGKREEVTGCSHSVCLVQKSIPHVFFSSLAMTLCDGNNSEFQILHIQFYASSSSSSRKKNALKIFVNVFLLQKKKKKLYWFFFNCNIFVKAGNGFLKKTSTLIIFFKKAIILHVQK